MLKHCVGPLSARRWDVMLRGCLLVILVGLFTALPILVTGRATTPSSLPVDTTKLVIDTDSGSDDAVAILLAIGHERCGKGVQVIGITCVHGNTALDNVVVNVLKTLQTTNRLDIPVYKGASQSLLITPPGDNFFGEDGFGDFTYLNAPKPEDYLQEERAVNALVRLAREHKGELTVLALGPLTNIALAIRMDPNFLKNIKQIAILGGSVEGVGNIKPGIEFNFFMDPEANFIVFNSSTNETKPIILVPWETVKERNKITTQWRNNVLGTKSSAEIILLNKAERLQLEGVQPLAQWVSADPIAAAVILQPNLITAYSQHHVDAETQGDYARGSIFVDYNDYLSYENTYIITGFNVSSYKELLIENLSLCVAKQ